MILPTGVVVISRIYCFRNNHISTVLLFRNLVRSHASPNQFFFTKSYTEKKRPDCIFTSYSLTQKTINHRDVTQRRIFQACVYALSSLNIRDITPLQSQGQVCRVITIITQITLQHTCTLPSRGWALLHTDLNEIHG